MKKEITKTMVKALLKNNVARVKGMNSKKGNKLDVNLRYEKNSLRLNFFVSKLLTHIQ